MHRASLVLIDKRIDRAVKRAERRKKNKKPSPAELAWRYKHRALLAQIEREGDLDDSYGF